MSGVRPAMSAQVNSKVTPRVAATEASEATRLGVSAYRESFMLANNHRRGMLVLAPGKPVGGSEMQFMKIAPTRSGWASGLLLAACVTAPATVWSQGTSSPPALRPDPRFDIQRYEVEGAKLVPAGRLVSALAPLTGPGRRFTDIEAAVQAVRDVYAQAGITAVQVLIPEQALEAGVVKLQVEELRVARIEITGARARARANLLQAVPALTVGSTPVDTVLSDQLRLANENPGRQMEVTFRTEDDGSLTGVLRVADRPAWSGQLSMDNTGSATTGKWRLAGAVQHANVLDRDLVASAQVQTSPGYEDAVKIGSVSLRAPLYRLGLLVDASVVHSSVDSGTVKTSAGDYLLSSSGTSVSLRATRLLPRWGAVDHRVSIGQDWRLVDSRVSSTAGGPSLVPDIELRPVTLTYSLNWRDERRSVFAQASVSRNLPG